MGASERAIRRNAELLRQGKIRNKARGAARNAFIDWDVTGKIRGEEDGPLVPGDGLPLGGLIGGGEGYGIYGGVGTKKSTKGKQKVRKEKIITKKRARKKINIQRDYVARIEEVLDSNRVRVSLSYEDGVNKYQHKGDDQRAETFKYWRVNYEKSNIERFKTYMISGNQHYLMVNDKLGADLKSRKVKLKQGLQQDINKLDRVYFAEKRLPDLEERVRLVPFEDRPDEGIFLRIPNLNSVDNPINFQGTNFQNHDGLLGSDTLLNFDLEEKLISGSLLDVKPNVDYQKTTTNLLYDDDDTGFGNYVNFSSAETRLRNFRKKLQLIENHTALSASLTSVTSSLSTIQAEEQKRQRVINSFDPFEHYMYFESSSYVSSSLGQFHDTAWPKMNSSEPYKLEHTSGSIAGTWYDNMILSASAFDQDNANSLRNTLPEHVSRDDNNNVFLEFMDMVGQQFDEVWVYVKSLTDVNRRIEKLSEGISKDVTIHFAKALGLELYMGNDLINLPEFLLGKNLDGSDKYEKPSEQLTEEIWKRILANLPFFIKAKGTERAVKGLLSCYGIPSSILRVREYGGPDKGTRVSYEIKRRFTRALDFRGSQYIRLQWDDTDSRKPFTTEFRFKTPEKSNQTLMHSTDKWAIQLVNSSSTEYGYLRFAVSSSQGVETLDTPKQKFHNNEMWSVMLTRASSSGGELVDDLNTRVNVYELSSNQYDSTKQKINYRTSASIQISGSASASAFTGKFLTTGRFFLGESGSAGTGGKWGNTGFSGSMMEFRWWSEVLSGSVFDNHTRTPKAYNGNTSASSYDNLLFRLPLDDNKDFSVAAQQTASATQYLTTYGTEPNGVSGSVNINGFTGNFFKTLVDQEKLKVPNVGPNRRNATKIRIEDNTLKTGTALSPDVRNEQSSQDFAPIDSNKLGIYFSPVDVINEDIAYSIADLNMDDLIGDPRDEFKYKYKTLGGLQREYFKRYSSSNNFWDYLRLLNFYDSSVFTQVRQLLPARADATVGVLIEPNILERRKEVIGKQPTFDNRIFSNADDYDEGILITRVISGSDDLFFNTADSSYNTYEGEANLAHFSGSHIGFLGMPSRLRVLGENDRKFGYGTTYLHASSSVPLKNFTEARVPIISGSRLSEKNEEAQYIFGNALSASKARDSINPKYYAVSTSFSASQFESVADSNNLFRSFYQGTKHTKDNSFDNKEPIEVFIVAGTTVETTDTDLTKLKTK